MTRIRVLVVIALSGGLLFGLGIVPRSVLAATIEVGSSTAYPCDRNGLADAIVAAGADGTVTFDCDPAVIQFDAGNPQIVISQDVTIDGSNSGTPIVLDGNDEARFFNFSDDVDSHLVLQNLTLQRGFHEFEGGAVNLGIKGSLTTINVTFLENNSEEYGAAIDSDGAPVSIESSTFVGNTSADIGGAINTNGLLTISQSTFVDNHADAYGGVIYNNYDGKLMINQSSFSGNSAGMDGGAIENEGALAVSQSSFVDNSAGGLSGAIDLYTGRAQVTSSTFTGNTAPSGSAISVYAGVEVAHVSWSTIVQPVETGSALYVDRNVTITGVIFAGSGDHCRLVSGALIDSFTLANDSSCGLDGVGSHQDVADLGLDEIVSTTINGVDQSYYPLQSGSPAINGGPSSCDSDLLDGIDPDQIGNQRPSQQFCDIGAIEYLATPTTLCANTWNGALRMSSACSRSEARIELPQDGPITLCVGKWNGATSMGSTCGRSDYRVTVDGDHTVSVCVNRWNAVVRVSNYCNRSEQHMWL